MAYSQDQIRQLQQTAGLLGVTVEQLMNLRRAPEAPAGQLSYGGDRDYVDLKMPCLPEQLESNQHALEPANDWAILHGVDQHYFDPTLVQESFSLPSHPACSTQQAPALVLNSTDARLFECDIDFFDLSSDLPEVPRTTDSLSSFVGGLGPGFVDVTPGESLSLADWVSKLSNPVDQRGERTSDIVGDWAVVPSSPVSKGSDGLSTKSKYQKVCPRWPVSVLKELDSLSTRSYYQKIYPSRPVSVSNCHAKSLASSTKVRKARSAYSASKRAQVAQNRDNNSCVRCRLQRNAVRALINSLPLTFGRY
jgi:hypothetical protein